MGFACPAAPGDGGLSNCEIKGPSSKGIFHGELPAGTEHTVIVPSLLYPPLNPRSQGLLAVT